uniref:TEF/HLF n=1 Tax=Phallusia mammillata TaxID=59560 RepID=A0A6F9DFE6_9ASCI|nr:TEF/HLF [Phallusia mammillata]
MDQYDNNQLEVGIEKNEMSLTMKYLLENPALLQPPETDNKEASKDDKLQDSYLSYDQSSAYLGPQIWDDLLLSDDLKLEPVSVDELLDIGTDDEFSDFNLLLSNKQQSQELSPGGSESSGKVSSQTNYCDMPSLLSDYSPEATEIPSPSQFFHVPVKDTQEFKSLSSGTNGTAAVVRNYGGVTNEQGPQQGHKASVSMHPSQHQVLRDQQATLLADIFCNQPAPAHKTNEQYNEHNQYGVKSNGKHPAAEVVPNVINGNPLNSPRLDDFVVSIANCSTKQSNATLDSMADGKRNTDGTENGRHELSTSSAPVRIPPPVKVDFIVDQADVIISTPLDVSLNNPTGEKINFDPTTRRFTKDELKPQPIIRKSRKVLVPPEGKDGRYWSRRTKNNAAAKRSREARRIKENQILMRANYLEQENISLKSEVTQLRQELKKVMDMVKGYEK